jgi:hypothetical protein
MGHNIVVSIGCHRGIGTTQSTLDTPQIQEANKVRCRLGQTTC